MATQYQQDGEFLDYTPGSAVTAGQVVVVGDRVFVAPKDIAANALGVLQTRGVWQLPKLSTDTPALGAILYWDAGNSRCTTTASSHKIIGHAAAAAGNGATEVQVLLGTD
jgi:predicted RecA/RadA family phage recombinase